MSPATTTSEEPADADGEGTCDVLTVCEIWLALDFPDHYSDPAQPPTAAPPATVEAP